MINFYEFIEFPDLICSKFMESVYKIDLAGINVFIVMELFFEVIKVFVDNNFKSD